MRRRSGGTCCPFTPSTPRYIDVHRYTPTLEFPHQPHRHPRRRRNRHPPFRREPLRRPPPISEHTSCGDSRPRLSSGAKLRDPCRRPGLRRRLPRTPHQTMGPGNLPDPDRVQPKEGLLPARGSPRPYIDERRYTKHPRRRPLRYPNLRRSHPPRCRALQLSLTLGRLPAHPHRTPGAVNRLFTRGSSLFHSSRLFLAAYPRSEIEVPRPADGRTQEPRRLTSGKQTQYAGKFTMASIINYRH